MGHLQIVNQETIMDLIRDGCISIRADLNKNIIKTTSDILSGVLATRKGDLVFPWIIKSRTGRNLGFKYVFKVSGSPIFVRGDPYPVKIPLEEYGQEFEVPLSEAEALDLWTHKLLWNAIGKKSLGRGRALTPQTPMEDDLMLDRINFKNGHNCKRINLGKSSFDSIPVTISPLQDQWNESLKRSLDLAEPSERLSLMDLDGIPWRRGKFFAVEKVLEAWLMENMDLPPCNNLRELILPIKGKIEWFGNYIPFGVQGSNMDIVLIQPSGQEKVITVIELKVGPLNQKGFIEAATQSIDYSLFLQKAFNAFGIGIKLNPVVLSGLSPRVTEIHSFTKENLTPKWITYELDPNGEVKFKQKA